MSRLIPLEPQQIGIIFRGKLLDNDKFLHNYNFKPGNKLNVIARSKKRKSKASQNENERAKIENQQNQQNPQRPRNASGGNVVRLDQIGDLSLRANRRGHFGNQLNQEIQQYTREILQQEPNEGHILANLMKTLGDTSNKRKLVRKKILQKRTFGFSVDQHESQEVLSQALNVLESLFDAKTENNYESYHTAKASHQAQDAESQDLEESIKELSENFTLHSTQLKWQNKHFQSPDNSVENNRSHLANRKDTRKGSEPNLISHPKFESNRKSIVSFKDDTEYLDNTPIFEHGPETDFELNQVLTNKPMRLDTLEDPSQHSLSMKFKRSEFKSDKSLKRHDFDFSKISFKIGEWVDFLDELNIWRDGQIINTNADKVNIVFHDEHGNAKENWIENNSSRVSFFKTHTTGAENSYFLSPVPQHPVNMKLEHNQEKNLVQRVTHIMSKLTDTFQETQKAQDRLQELKQEIKEKETQIAPHKIAFDKEFIPPKANKKENDDETRSQVSMQVSGGNRHKHFFDDSRSLRNDEIPKKDRWRFRKKDLETLSPKSIKSGISGNFGFLPHIDENLSQFTYGVIQEENYLSGTSAEASENLMSENEHTERAESVRAQKGFSLGHQLLDKRHHETEQEVKRRRRQLGVLCDRMGRMLVDLAPHLMIDSHHSASQEDFDDRGLSNKANNMTLERGTVRWRANQSEAENASHLNSISMMTFDGSLYSGGRIGLFDQVRRNNVQLLETNHQSKPNALRFKEPRNFQIPILLTPGELLQANNPDQLPLQDVDPGVVNININAVVRNPKARQTTSFSQTQTQLNTDIFQNQHIQQQNRTHARRRHPSDIPDLHSPPTGLHPHPHDLPPTPLSRHHFDNPQSIQPNLGLRSQVDKHTLFRPRNASLGFDLQSPNTLHIRRKTKIKKNRNHPRINTNLPQVKAISSKAFSLREELFRTRSHQKQNLIQAKESSSFDNLGNEDSNKLELKLKTNAGSMTSIKKQNLENSRNPPPPPPLHHQHKLKIEDFKMGNDSGEDVERSSVNKRDQDYFQSGKLAPQIPQISSANQDSKDFTNANPKFENNAFRNSNSLKGFQNPQHESQAPHQKRKLSNFAQNSESWEVNHTLNYQFKTGEQISQLPGPTNQWNNQPLRPSQPPPTNPHQHPWNAHLAGKVPDNLPETDNFSNKEQKNLNFESFDQQPQAPHPPSNHSSSHPPTDPVSNDPRPAPTHKLNPQSQTRLYKSKKYSFAQMLPSTMSMKSSQPVLSHTKTYLRESQGNHSNRNHPTDSHQVNDSIPTNQSAKFTPHHRAHRQKESFNFSDEKSHFSNFSDGSFSNPTFTYDLKKIGQHKQFQHKMKTRRKMGPKPDLTPDSGLQRHSVGEKNAQYSDAKLKPHHVAHQDPRLDGFGSHHPQILNTQKIINNQINIINYTSPSQTAEVQLKTLKVSDDHMDSYKYSKHSSDRNLWADTTWSLSFDHSYMKLIDVRLYASPWSIKCRPCVIPNLTYHPCAFIPNPNTQIHNKGFQHPGNFSQKLVFRQNKSKPKKSMSKPNISGFPQQNLITSLKKIPLNDHFSSKSLKNSKTFKSSQRAVRFDNSSLKKAQLRKRKNKRFEDFPK